MCLTGKDILTISHWVGSPRMQCLKQNSIYDCPKQRFQSQMYTVKPVLSDQSKRRPKLVFKTDYRLIQAKSIAECSPWSILQHFRPSLSYHLSLRSLFCLFLSGCLRQVCLYKHYICFLLSFVLMIESIALWIVSTILI